jgi:hypothetical protein
MRRIASERVEAHDSDHIGTSLCLPEQKLRSR